MFYFHGVNLIFALAGFVVAVVVGLTGVGGGSLMTPILYSLFGIAPATAVGTDLLFACITKTVGTGVHGFSKTIDWRVVAALAMGSIPATALCLLALARFQDRWNVAHGPITTVLGVALILTAISMIFRKALLRFFSSHVGDLSPRRVTLFTIALGAILGTLVSLSSVGAGAIGMTVLLMLYPKLPAARLVGSDIAHAVPLTFVAGLGHWWLGTVDWPLLGSLLAGSIPGIIVGSFIASRISDKVLRPMLAGVLGFVGLRLAF